jgi:DoxX-like family
VESILKPRPVTHSVYANVPSSKVSRRAGAIMTGIATLFLLVDSVGKLIPIPPAVEFTVRLGYPESAVRLIGMILLVCLILYVVPRTSVLGAVLLTGYLGGAVASQLRLESPLLSTTLFPIYVGVLVWGGLMLREDRLRALFPLRR